MNLKEIMDGLKGHPVETHVETLKRHVEAKTLENQLKVMESVSLLFGSGVTTDFVNEAAS